MKSFSPLATLAVLSLGLALPLIQAKARPAQSFVPAPFKILTGEAMFLERIALPPGAMLHVSLVGRVAGAEYLPLSTAVTPAKNGITPFQLQLSKALPPGPYRLQAWIIGDNRALFIGRDPQAVVENFDKSLKIRLKMAPKLQNIDGIGDGKPLAMGSRHIYNGLFNAMKPQKIILRGQVLKLDRRALSPDSRIEIELRDVSLADAPSKLVVGQAIQLEGGQLPRNFELEVAAAELQPRRRYALSARVYEAGKLSYITNTLHEVNAENIDKHFDLRVVSAAP